MPKNQMKFRYKEPTMLVFEYKVAKKGHDAVRLFPGDVSNDQAFEGLNEPLPQVVKTLYAEDIGIGEFCIRSEEVQVHHSASADQDEILERLEATLDSHGVSLTK